MKVVNICMQDPAGAAYALSHALNKFGHQAVSIRANDNYIHYPTISALRMYEAEGVRRIAEKADVVVFHQAVQPFLKAIGIDPKKLKKKIVYFHGSECRNMGPQIVEQAKELLGDFQVLVSTPDLLKIVDGIWMPVCRSFSEIQSKYALSKRDEAALASFSEPRSKVLLTHAPTNIEIKGSTHFYKVINDVVENTQWVEFQPIQNAPWDVCLRMIASSDIMFDNYLLGIYGLVSVEAAIFRLPVVTRIDPFVAEVMERESGLKQPFIQWPDDDTLRDQVSMMCDRERGPELRDRFGELAYRYCKRMHDDKPIAERFTKLVEEMP